VGWIITDAGQVLVVDRLRGWSDHHQRLRCVCVWCVCL
jgi:hypothetical protein